MRIAFFGLPLAALLLARDGHDIVYAAICRRDAIGTRRLRRTLGEDRVEVKPDAGSAAVLARVIASKPDLLVSWFWTTRLPQPVLRTPKLGAFGVHPSLLPRFRGPDPYFWAIDMGDAETGVTAHRLEAEYDTGAILARRSIAIDRSWSAWTLAKKLDRPSLVVLREVAKGFAEGNPPKEELQDDARSTSAPIPDDVLLVLRWTWPAERIVRRVRAASPWPGALAQIGDVEITLTRAVVTTDFPRALAPGEGAVIDGRAVVRAGDDAAVELLEGRRSTSTDTDLVLDRTALARLVENARCGS